jgi:hypothetical protein
MIKNVMGTVRRACTCEALGLDLNGDALDRSRHADGCRRLQTAAKTSDGGTLTSTSNRVAGTRTDTSTMTTTAWLVRLHCLHDFKGHRRLVIVAVR